MFIFKKRKKYIHNYNVSIVEGDITTMDTDVVVNSTNEMLSANIGISYNIHKKAGPELKEYLKNNYRRCVTGDCVISPGFNLKSKYIIHVATPTSSRCPENFHNESLLMESCFITLFKKANSLNVKNIMIPMIGAGANGWDASDVIGIGYDILKITKLNTIRSITFVTYNDIDTHNVKNVIAKMK